MLIGEHGFIKKNIEEKNANVYNSLKKASSMP